MNLTLPGFDPPPSLDNLPAGFRRSSATPGRERMLCDACGFTRPVAKQCAAAHAKAHTRARVLAVRFGAGFVPVYLTVGQYVVERRGADAIHDPFGFESCALVGLAQRREDGDGIEGFPHSLHWIYRDVADEVRATLGEKAHVSRWWLAVMLRAEAIHRVTGAPPWLAMLAARVYIAPLPRPQRRTMGLPSWLSPGEAVEKLFAVIDTVQALNEALP